LGLLVLGLATIGSQLQESFDTSVRMQRMLRSVNLMESKLAELDARLIPDIEDAIQDDLEHEFGRLFPDYGWRLRIEPTQTPDLWLVKLEILYQRREDVEEEFDFDAAPVVHTVYTLRATPATIDPSRDFGADEDTMKKLSDAFGGTDIDPTQLDLRLLAGQPLESLIGVLQTLQEAGLLQGVDLGSFLPPDIMQLLEEATGDAGTGGLEDAVEGVLQNGKGN